MRINTLLQYLLPHHLCSRLIGKLASSKQLWLKNLLIRWLIKKYKIELNEILEPNLASYACFNDFFTRALKPDARPISAAPGAIISPTDGHISQLGNINEHTLIQAKGHNFNLQSLFGKDIPRSSRGMTGLEHPQLLDQATAFENGTFATLYLSPHDYHRVHMPVDGTLTHMLYVPGRIFSVSPSCVKAIPNIYSRNERVICLFDTALGPMAVILVGAVLVASIETVWAGLVTPRQRKIYVKNYSNESVALKQGAEIGRFQFGSTVILLFPQHSMNWQQNLVPGAALKMGELVGIAINQE